MTRRLFTPDIYPMRKYRTIGPFTAGLIFGAFCLCVGAGLGVLAAVVVGWV